MVPFQPVPTTEPPLSLKTTWNEVMGLAKAVSTIRTAPLKPPDQDWVDRTSTVSPLAVTAVLPIAPAFEAPSGCPPQATRPSASSPTMEENDLMALLFRVMK